ncbi:MAG TPA: EAL domain-containing protein [Gammaproteobacteria bacterium]|nr:EAL domain-containing protein [Gammaproteobacteria bacterium]
MSASMTSKLVVTPEAPAKAAVEERLLQGERITTIRHSGRWMDIGIICLAGFAAFAFWEVRPPHLMVTWLVFAIGISMVRLIMSWTYNWFVLTESGRRTWQDAFLALTVTLGIVWGLGGWLFFEPNSMVHWVALLALLLMVGTIPVFALSTHRQVYVSYLAAMFSPLMVKFISMFSFQGIAATMACFAILAVLWLLADEGGREILANLRFRMAYREARGQLADEVTTRTHYELRAHDEADRTLRKESKLLEIALDRRITGGNLREACELISEYSAHASGCGRVSIWFMHGNKDKLRCTHVFRHGKHITKALLDIDRVSSSALFEQLAKSRSIAVSDVTRAPMLSSAWNKYFRVVHASAALFVPFRNGGGVRGMILHEWARGGKTWTPGDVELASALADSMTVAVHAAERSQAETEMRKLATTDQLTHLPNRPAFIERLNQAISHAKRNAKKMALLFVDVDRFKTINDSLGHHIGDEVLQEIGRRLTHCVRHEDTVARLGGDEFVVLMEDCSDPKSVIFTCERIIAALSSAVVAGGMDLHPGCSIGISMYPQDGDDQTTLLKNADMAMYRAKERGRNRFEFFTTDMQAQAVQRLARENALRSALERHEFTLHYQPQFDLRRGIYGVEALLRWEHPELGLVPPAEFIPLAEDTGLVVPIGRWVLREACRQMKVWQDASGDKRLQVSVNLSVRQFVQGTLVEMVKEALDATGLPPGTLKLEITESMVMQDIDNNLQMLEDLKLLGVRIALDDFGKEHSSMTYLKRLPIDAIKLDRDFVKGVGENPYDRAIIHCLLALADCLRIKAIAEGVETPEQLSFLKKEGCRYVQGYLYSPPLVAADCGRLICGELDLAV